MAYGKNIDDIIYSELTDDMEYPDWVELALAALDQAGCTVEEQQSIRAIADARLDKNRESIERWKNGPSLTEWLEAWEREVLDGQTSISRDEAIKRWEQEQEQNV